MINFTHKQKLRKTFHLDSFFPRFLQTHRGPQNTLKFKRESEQNILGSHSVSSSLQGQVKQKFLPNETEMNAQGLHSGYEAWTEEPQVRSSPDPASNSDSFKSLLPVVRLSNIFGLLPLSVVAGHFRSTRCSFLTFYAVMVSGTLIGFFILRLLALFVNSEPVQDWVTVLTATIFYLLGASGSLLLWRLARKLPEVSKKWVEWECRVGVTGSTHCVVVLLLSVVMVSGIVETAASMFYNVSHNCTNNFWVYLQCYITTGHNYEMELVGYSDAVGVIVLFINKYATFVWNFNDMLVACIAIILWRHLKAFNVRVEEGAFWWREKEWLRTRENHLALLRLMSSMNDALGPIILQSYVTNLFFTLVQLYLGIRPVKEENIISKLYLTWSFIHLMGRLLLVSFTCSAVYDCSKKSLIYLLTIPMERFTVEIWRLQQQLQEQEVGLSGFGFFLVNKSFILATTGALVTYEVILLQLNVGTERSG